MNSNTKSSTSLPEDIDLLLLLERSFLFFRKYKWIFIAASLFGISLGIFGYIVIPTTYKSRLILHSYFLTNSEEIGIIDNWNGLLKKKEYGELAAAFHCDPKFFRKIKQLKASEIQKVFTPGNPNGFYIDVIVMNNQILDELQKGILYGLENSEYVKQRLDAKKADLKELIEKVQFEIIKLDSTKTQMENIIGGREKSSSSLIIDGSSINRQLIEMNEKLLSFRQDLKFANALQVLQHFSKFTKPAGPHLLPLLALGLILCLSIAYVIALFNSIKEKLKAHSFAQKNT
jgi:hypothetical protein